jgi:hypothetical protein
LRVSSTPVISRTRSTIGVVLSTRLNRRSPSLAAVFACTSTAIVVESMNSAGLTSTTRWEQLASARSRVSRSCLAVVRSCSPPRTIWRPRVGANGRRYLRRALWTKLATPRCPVQRSESRSVRPPSRRQRGPAVAAAGYLMSPGPVLEGRIAPGTEYVSQGSTMPIAKAPQPPLAH